MIDGLKPYPAYKNSGLPSLGHVPTHWHLMPIGRAFRAITRRDVRGDEPKMSMSRHLGLVTSSNLGVRSSAKSESLTYSVCHPGDLVMNKYQAHAGLFGAAQIRGLITPNYSVFRPSPHCISNYFARMFASTVYQAAFQMESRGVGDGMAPLYTGAFYRIQTVVPPLAEQTAIVRFLNHAERRISRFFRAKQKLIKLAEEQKQAIVHRAVTRGLDPRVRLKASGIDWLGDIPDHWEIRRAKAVCQTIVDCKNRTPEAIEGGQYLVVRTTCIRHGQFDSTGGYRTDETNFLLWTARGRPRTGDVFFTREAPSGEACLVPDRDDLCMGQRMMYLRPDSEMLDERFLLLNIYGPLTHTYVELATNGSTVGHLRLGQVYGLPILWCPLDEQRAIVKYVDETTAGLDRTRAIAEREIALLREYRTRLIADVVTGKLDVRGAVAHLPAEVTDAEPLDDTDTPTAVDDDTDATELDENPEDPDA